VEFVALKDYYETTNYSTDKRRKRKLCLIQTVQKNYVMSLLEPDTGTRNMKLSAEKAVIVPKPFKITLNQLIEFSIVR
jgi:hypothetical protein